MNDVQVTDAEFWHVQLPSGEVAYWSLDELDEAFNRDAVDANTFVLKVGEASWQRLGELLGLDEAPAAAAVVAAVPVSIAPASFGGNDLYGAQSIRPVVADLSDLDDDDLAAAMKPKRKNLAAMAGGAVVALALVIVGITHAASGSDGAVAAAAAPTPVEAVVAAPDPAAADPGSPQATLSDDMKRQLLAADKVREAKAAARAAETAKYHTHSRSYRAPKSGNVFHKGGNKYDPLSAD
jgi:hypothetical protein